MYNDYNINCERMQVVKTKSIDIPYDAIVSACRQGDDYIDVSYSARKCGATVRRINKDEYLCVSTGDIRKYSKCPKNKTQVQFRTLKRTFERLRGLIRHNFSAKSENQLFITLTYKKNMKDPKKLYKDFIAFYKRLKRAFKEHEFEYIVVAEPQGRGAWHLHLMLKSVNKPVLYIDNKKLSKIWGHGFTDVQRLKSDDVGSYYSAYFTDLLEENKQNNSKKRKKNARLVYYPVGFRLYRCSKGIIRPKRENVRYGDIALSDSFSCSFVNAYNIVDGYYFFGGEVFNFIQKEVFKRRCKT